MDPSTLFEQHGPTGFFLIVVLTFLRWMMAGGTLTLTVRHDKEQMRQLGETIGKAAGQVTGVRVDALEEQSVRHTEQLGTLGREVTRIDERTRSAPVAQARRATGAAR